MKQLRGHINQVSLSFSLVSFSLVSFSPARFSPGLFIAPVNINRSHLKKRCKRGSAISGAFSGATNRFTLRSHLRIWDISC